MDGQNFENGQNEQGAQPVVEPVNAQPVVEPANTNTYQDNVSAYTGTYQDNTSTYTGTYQDTTAAYSSDVYGSAVNDSKGQTPGTAIAGLVFGIIGIVTGCCGCPAVIFGIVGLILAIVANKQKKSGVGTAALICSIISIVLGCIMFVFTVIPVMAEMLAEL